MDESELLERFCASGFLTGQITRGKSVGGKMPESGAWVQILAATEDNKFTRTVDVLLEGDSHWIVEVKAEHTALNFDTAFGQVLIKEFLYRQDEDIDHDQTQAVILLGSMPPTTSADSQTGARLFDLLDQFDVRVVVWTGSEFRFLADVD